MKYEEFRDTIQKKTQQKQAKIRNCFGVYDCYKHMRKNSWYDIGRPLKEKEYYAIIRGINDLLAENIAGGIDVKFPWGMGNLEIHKVKCGVSLVDGKLKNTYPISWPKTIQLWYEDEEARKNKILVREEYEYLHIISYNKHDANYQNQSYYQFSPNRFVKLALAENIKKGKIDSLW